MIVKNVAAYTSMTLHVTADRWHPDENEEKQRVKQKEIVWQKNSKSYLYLMCQHFEGWLCNNDLMTQLLYLKCLCLNKLENLNYLKLRQMLLWTVLQGLFVSCRWVGWFSRQPVNYLFQQLCLKAGRVLTLPLQLWPQEAVSVLSSVTLCQW